MMLTEQTRQEIAELERRYQRSLLRSPRYLALLLAWIARRELDNRSA